jgi:hypothetical protein
MAQKRFYNRLSGVNPLAYVGVEPLAPPQLLIDSRSPTSDDSVNINIGTLWFVDVSPFELWQLALLTGTVATWIQLFPASGSGGATTFPTDSGTATQVGGVLNIFGSSSITQTTGSGNTVTVLLVNGSDGQVLIGGGANPMWNNITSTGGSVSITNGPNSINLEATSTGTVVNFQGNSGPVVPPTAMGTINVLGTNGISTSGNAGTHTLTITTASGQPFLQSLTGNSGGTVFADGSNNINVVGTGVVSVAGNPGTHTLTISAGTTVATSFPTDSGTAIPAAGALTVHGGTLIGTTGSGSTVTANLDNGLNGQIIIGATAGSPAYANITSTGGSVTITNGPNSINLEASGIVPPATSAVLAYKSVTSVGVTGDGTISTVIFDTEIYDIGSNYDNTTGIFTAPATGKYIVDTMVFYGSFALAGDTISQINTLIVTSNRTYQWLNENFRYLSFNNQSFPTSQSVVADMDAADTCIIQASAGFNTQPRRVSIGGDPTTLFTLVNFQRVG